MTFCHGPAPAAAAARGPAPIYVQIPGSGCLQDLRSLAQTLSADLSDLTRHILQRILVPEYLRCPSLRTP